MLKLSLTMRVLCSSSYGWMRTFYFSFHLCNSSLISETYKRDLGDSLSSSWWLMRTRASEGSFVLHCDHLVSGRVCRALISCLGRMFLRSHPQGKLLERNSWIGLDVWFCSRTKPPTNTLPLLSRQGTKSNRDKSRLSEKRRWRNTEIWSFLICENKKEHSTSIIKSLLLFFHAHRLKRCREVCTCKANDSKV